jgi:hypothetical protein
MIQKMNKVADYVLPIMNEINVRYMYVFLFSFRLVLDLILIVFSGGVVVCGCPHIYQ